ncbi:hypothetical protein H7X46_02775 [Pseudonocardia sp. C8]|uniref:hypothetical protein n=1 Tax=Pseudonocardia sp. C8 TaxID=2762759 RepID=UPI001642F633|nr:hypothetical protein [Pseudonocardia sp. C8]MBC3189986.1 hypothetical protein [Pseudonocardia sp. C8]
MGTRTTPTTGTGTGTGTAMNPITPAPVERGQTAYGAAAVMSMAVRVAGQVPTRVDLQNAGTAEQQLGLTLGAVLVYLRSSFTARIVEQGWAQAAPLARSLVPVLGGRARGVMATGPWSATALVRLGGTPKVDIALLPVRPGSDRPSILHIEIGPISWEMCDANSYTALLHGWRTAANLLTVQEALDK